MNEIDALIEKAGTVSTIDRPEVWENVLGLPVDYHPWFGWNIPRSGEMKVGLSLAVQCASVKARDIAKAGMELWKKERSPGGAGILWNEVLPDEHWFARKLSRRPNSYQSWGDFWRLLILHLELVQDCYILIVRNGFGEVTELLPLPPARVTMMVEPRSREVFYDINAGNEVEQAQLGAPYVRVPQASIIHVMGRSMDGITGISNIVLGGSTFDLIGAIQGYQNELFGRRGRPPVAFETSAAFEDTIQGETAFRRLKEQLSDRWEAGKPLLLEAGLQAKILGQTARENMTTEAYNAQVVRICTLMMVPPHKIFAYESVKYDNAAHADNQYAVDILTPIADNIEDKFRLALFTDKEQDLFWPEFNRRLLVASDPKAVLERVKIGMQLGLLTYNEGRAELGYNPVEGGDRRMQPAAMQQIDEDGEIIKAEPLALPEGAPGDAGPQPADEGGTTAVRHLKLVGDV